MTNCAKPLVLAIDDSQDSLKLIERFLTSSGYSVVSADSGLEGLKMVGTAKPDLILLDVMMGEMDGYEVCARLQENEETAYVPVIFVTALGQEQDKAKAFSLGAVDYLVKPIKKHVLTDKVSAHIKTHRRWEKLRKLPIGRDGSMLSADFGRFKGFLSDKLDFDSRERFELSNAVPGNIYSLCAKSRMSHSQMAQYVAEFLRVPYVSHINPEDVQLGVLPTPFCRSKRVVAVSDGTAEQAFILSNPFDWDLLDNLKKFTKFNESSKLIISEPDNIELLFRPEASKVFGGVSVAKDRQKGREAAIEVVAGLQESEANAHPIVFITNHMLEKAAAGRASDIHIESKEAGMVVRFRTDGDLREAFTLKKNTGAKVISRLKVLALLDITEKRKPQDGAFSAIINNRRFNIRVATTSTPSGESLVMRLLEPNIKPKELQELGMTGEQADSMISMVNRSAGFILVVGTTGSGKTTTIYSLLHKTDFATRSLMSVEDPIEYRIPFANQQQVNEKAGVTFEALLKSAVRQDPDILFMGEVRDGFSAKTAVDFASTGHLTISTLHTSNATTAIFRLERLGVDRGIMSDTILGVVAQKLVKKLCSHCKIVVGISKEEMAMISPFTNDIPKRIAHPVGCAKCDNTGYRGRDGVYEIIQFDAAISERVRAGLPISRIRAYAQERGDYLIGRHAVEKVRELIVTPREAYEKVLVEDIRLKKRESRGVRSQSPPPATKKARPNSILIVDDDEDTRKLVGLILKNRGYKTTICQDGIDALMHLDKKDFGLVISDVNMPNLDGFKLLEIMKQKGQSAPVVFLTSRDGTEDEKKGLELGAMDYIKKPIEKEILLLRVKSTLERQIGVSS